MGLNAERFRGQRVVVEFKPTASPEFSSSAQKTRAGRAGHQRQTGGAIMARHPGDRRTNRPNWWEEILLFRPREGIAFTIFSGWRLTGSSRHVS